MNHAIEIALAFHLLGMVIWMGGTFFLHICLRPAMRELSPQLRLPLWEPILARFFTWIATSAWLILLSGMYLLMRFGGAEAPWQIHAMAGLGVIMMLVFGHARFAMFPRLRRAVQAERWPEGARPLTSIQRMLAVNLGLGLLTSGLGVFGHGG